MVLPFLNYRDNSEKLEVGTYENLYVSVVNAEAKPYCTLAWFPAKLV